jgi:dTMP kinase
VWLVRKKLFIAIEGVDGVGKTTCAKLLSKIIPAHYYKTPPNAFIPLRERAESLNAEARFLFYLCSVAWASQDIKELIKNEPVICDRYIFSTLAYHKALGVDVSTASLNKLSILMPDISICLLAQSDKCSERLKKRGSTSSTDRRLEEDKRLQQKISNAFTLLPMVFVETTNLSLEEVCTLILDIIKKKEA